MAKKKKSLWSKIKSAFTTKVNVKKYTQNSKNTKSVSRKGKVVKKNNKVTNVTAKAATKSTANRGSAAREQVAIKKKAANNAAVSRKGKATTPTVKKTVKKYSEVGKTKAKEQTQYEKWKKREAELKQEASKDNPISVKRGRSYYLKNNIAHTTGVGDDGKRKAYKTTKEFYQKNPVAQKRQADIVKGQYQYGNKAYAGATDRIKQNLGMKTKSEQADERLGTNIDKSKAVQKTKKSKGYEVGQLIGDVAAFAAPGMAEENIARGILSGSTKAVKAASAGIRGTKVLTTAEKTAAKALVKNDKVRKFAAERAADALVSSPMNLAAASADSEDGKGTLKNFAMNVAGDVAMGSAMSALKAGKTKAGKIDAVRTAKADAKRAEKARAEKAVADEAKRWEEKSTKVQSAVKNDNSNTVAKAALKIDVNERLKGLDAENKAKTHEIADIKESQGKNVRRYLAREKVRNATFEEPKTKKVKKEASKRAEVTTEKAAETGVEKPVKRGRVNSESSSKKTFKEKVDSAKEYAKNLVLEFREKMIDKNAALQSSARKAGNKDGSAALYATDITNSHVNHDLLNEQRNYDRTQVMGRSAKDILEPYSRYDAVKKQDFNELLAYRNNLSRSANGRDMFGNEAKAGYAQSKKIVEELEAKYADDPEFLAMADEIADYSLNLLDAYEKSGIISKEQRLFLEENNPYHLTAFRDFDPKESMNLKEGNARISGLERAEGSELPLLSVDDQVIRETYKAYRASDINMAMREFAVNNKRKIFDGESREIARTDGELDEMFAIKNDDAVPGYQRVYFRDNGRQKYFYASDAEAREFRNMIVGDKTGSIGKFLDYTTGTGVKVIKTFSTSLSPSFILRNPIRDLQAALINSIDTSQFIKNLPRAIDSLLKKDGMYELFEASGAKMTNLVANEKTLTSLQADKITDAFQKFGNGEISKGELIRSIGHTLGTPLRAIEWLNNFCESISRHTEFLTMCDKIMKENGYSDISQLTRTDINKMAQAASEVSVNFSRSGTIGKLINKRFVPFFNAGIQGLSREYRLVVDAATSKDIKKIAPLIAKVALFGLAPSAVNELLIAASGDEDFKREYNELTTYNRLQNYFFKAGDRWYKIPAGRVNSIFGMVSRLIVNPKNYSLEECAEIALSLAAPADIWSDSVIAPYTNTKNNRYWYGGEINTKWELEDVKNNKKTMADLSDETTSEYAKFFAKTWLGEHFLNWSPKQFDAFIDQFGGSWAKMLHSANDRNYENESSKISKIPVLGKPANEVISQMKDAFSVNVTAKNNLTTNYYAKIDDLKRRQSQYVNDKSKEGKAKYKKYQKQIDNLKQYSYRISDINDAMVEIQKEKDFDKDSALRLKSLQKYRNQLLRNAIAGKKSSDSRKALDVQKMRECVGSDKKVAKNILFKDDSSYDAAEKKLLKSGYKNYKKLLDVYEDKQLYGTSTKCKALALIKNNADKKLVQAYGVSDDDIAETKKALKSGVSYSELSTFYTSVDKTKKKMGISGSYTPTFIEFLALAKAGGSANLNNYMMSGKAASLSYRQIKANAARAVLKYNIDLEKLSKARATANTSGDTLTDSQEAKAYIEKHYKNSSTKIKAILWEAICNRYSDTGKNPYGQVEKVSAKTTNKTYNNKKVKEISKDFPTVIGNSQLTKKEKNSLANKAWLSDKLAVANKAKAVAKGKADVSTLLEEIDKQSGNNGFTRMTRSYFKKADTTSVKTEGSSSGGKSYRKKSYSKRSGGSSGGSSSSSGRTSASRTTSVKHGASKITKPSIKVKSAEKTSKPNYSSVTVKAAKRTITSAGSASYKKTKAYGMTDSEINALYRKLVKEYGESTASKVMLKLSTVIK